MLSRLLTIGFTASFAASLCWAQQPPSIISFTPQGTVKQIRQVQVSFSAPMVPFGDPGVADPFTIECPAEGAGRWVDSSQWVFDFDRDLPAGIQCSFFLKPGTVSLMDEPLAGQRIFEFSTGGPAIIASAPYEGSHGIEEAQVFILELDGEVDPGSVLRQAHFAVDGSIERIGVRLLEGKIREELLDTQYNYRYRAASLDARLVVLQGQLHFPQAKEVRLIWDAGIATPSGVVTSSPQVLAFQTRPDFRASFFCSKENPDRACNPLTPVHLELTAAVSWEDVSGTVLVGPGGKVRQPSIPSPPPEWLQLLVFEGPFEPESEFLLKLPEGLRDDAGRPLINAGRYSEYRFQTDEYPPLAQFSGSFGVLEWKDDPVLPLTVRNIEADLDLRILELGTAPLSGRFHRVEPDDIEQLLMWLSRSRYSAWESRGVPALDRTPPPGPNVRQLTLSRPNGGDAFEVIGIPLPEPGFHVIEVKSQILGERLLSQPKPYYVATTALVTDLSAHFKWGAESSVVWVTSLKSGRPVSDVRVQVWNCSAELVAEAVSDRMGVARLVDLPRPDDTYSNCENRLGGLLVTVRSDKDFSFVHSSWNEGIEPWRFQLPVEYRNDFLSMQTVMDRALFRAGETVHMKHFVRRRSESGLRFPDVEDLPKSLEIEHRGSGQKFPLPLTWGPQGTAEGSWRIPRDARLGHYQLRFTTDQQNSWYSSSFRVEEYRLPLMQASIRAPDQDLVDAREARLGLAVRYLSGGPAASLPVTLRYQVSSRAAPQFDGFEGFWFANGRVVEEIARPGEEARPASSGEGLPLTLDGQGSASVTLTSLPQLDTPGLLQAELEFRDPNGEVQTVASRLPLWPSRVLVGIKPESWAASASSLKFQAAVVDLRGRPVAGSRVRFELFQELHFTHRKRLIGGFYEYDHVSEIRPLNVTCEGESDGRGLVFCDLLSPVSGSVILQASAADADGRVSYAKRGVWVAGEEDWWFRVSNEDRIDLIPQEIHYEPGEKATLQVRMPFRTATALVTVEREGVMDVYLKKISGRSPVVRLPVKSNYAPNVFVSVMAVRGRVAGVRPDAMVDLGRPAYKLGIAELKVGWKGHRLDVKVNTRSSVYKVREKVRARIQVKSSRGRLPEGAEVAVAAVDEALLELLPNGSWSLLENIMGRRGYAVNTSTAQMHVVGKRHFGVKAIPHGGGGGRQSTREIFDSLLYWKARVPLDRKGRAEVEIPLNDSLSSFRIVAIASAGPDRFGTGSTSVRTTQDLQLFAGIPPEVRTGDLFQAGFTLRNASSRPMDLQVSLSVTPRGGSTPVLQVPLAAGESRVVEWPIAVPDAVSGMEYLLEASADGVLIDSIRVQQKVRPATPTRVYQATLVRLAPDYSSLVQAPAGALPQRGGLTLAGSRTLLSSLDSVIEYMDAYPYGCLEQKASRFAAIGDRDGWDGLMATLSIYLDHDGLARYFPTNRNGSEVLTSYILSLAHQRGWPIPEEFRRQMVEGLQGFVEGRVQRQSALPTTDLTLRKLGALEALSRHGSVPASLIEPIDLQPLLWPTSGVIDWLAILIRTPDLQSRPELRQQAEQILRSRLNLQGTTMGFSSEREDRLWWLMVSPDLNAVRLLSLLLEAGIWQEDLPRLMVGALNRRQRGHWDLTTANAWGVLAMEAFASRFEADPLIGETVIQSPSTTERWQWDATTAQQRLELPWSAAAGPLSVSHEGSGTPWLTLFSRAAVPLRDAVSSGYRISREVMPIQQASEGIWRSGDIARIRIEIDAQTDMSWVVVEDPIPAGSVILGSGLGRDSDLATSGEEAFGARPTFEERSLHSFRAYYRFLSKGRLVVEYTVRLNNPGIFQLPATRVEAMYHPELHGELPNFPLEVKP